MISLYLSLLSLVLYAAAGPVPDDVPRSPEPLTAVLPSVEVVPRDEVGLARRDFPDGDLASTKITFDTGYMTYQLEADTTHFCGSDVFKQISRPGTIYGSKKADITAADYLAAVKTDPKRELDLLKQDLQADIDVFAPIAEAIGSCPSNSPRDLQPRQPDRFWNQYSARNMAMRVVFWKFPVAFMDNFIANFFGRMLDGESLTEAARGAAFSATGVSLVQVTNGILDYLNKTGQLAPVWYVFLRFFGTPIASLVNTFADQFNRGRPFPQTCADWELVASYLPIVRPSLAAGQSVSDWRNQHFFTVYERADDRDSWGYVRREPDGNIVRRGEIEGRDDKITDPHNAAMMDESVWSAQVKSKPATCDKDSRTLADMLKDEGQGGWDVKQL